MAYTTQLFDSIRFYKSWILQLTVGLKALHSVGIVHRELRLANLLVTSDGLICDLEASTGKEFRDGPGSFEGTCSGCRLNREIGHPRSGKRDQTASARN